MINVVWKRFSTLFLVVTMIVLFTGCDKLGGEPYESSLNTPIPFGGGSVIGQTVNPRGGEVSGVDLAIATYGTSPDPSGVLAVTLRDPDTHDVLGRTERTGGNVDETSWTAFTFDPPISIGDSTLFEVTWDGQTPIAVWGNVPLHNTGPRPDDPPLENNAYQDGQLMINGEVVPGDLAFRVRTPQTFRDGVSYTVEVATTAVVRVFQQRRFFVLWVLFVVGSCILIWVGFRKDNDGAENVEHDLRP